MYLVAEVHKFGGKIGPCIAPQPRTIANRKQEERYIDAALLVLVASWRAAVSVVSGHA